MACLESDANVSGCDIPHMLWSGRSSNKVPVATQHTMNISDPAKKQQLATIEMMAARQHVLDTIERLEKTWTGDGLQITLFSTEGDMFSLTSYVMCN